MDRLADETSDLIIRSDRLRVVIQKTNPENKELIKELKRRKKTIDKTLKNRRK